MKVERHKNLSEKGATEREAEGGGSKRIISMHCEKKQVICVHLSQALHYAQNLIAQKLLVF
jgi:hypothetical protein